MDVEKQDLRKYLNYLIPNKINQCLKKMYDFLKKFQSVRKLINFAWEVMMSDKRHKNVKNY